MNAHVLPLSPHEQLQIADPRPARELNTVVYGHAVGEEPEISDELWGLMLVEFKRNGGQTLTCAKVRQLRDQLSLSRRSSS